jgi:2-C-methyl-D-erythritol 4-phosphate cytidylyltransferase
MFRKKHSAPKATAIIVAAGSSRRMCGADKQLITIDGMPTLAHTLLQFSNAESIDSVIVVTKPESILTVGDIVREFGITKVSNIIPGGETRQDSVCCGLSYVENDRLVAIHDGARPFISVDKINELVSAAYEFGAAAPGVMPKDTVKAANQDNTIAETLDRNTLRLIQTPQVFYADQLKLAYERAKASGFVGTDDCSVAENSGINIRIIDGEYTNIKVTTPEDLPIAEAIYHFLNN